MATTLGFKDLIDLPEWRPLAPCMVTAAAGTSHCNDMRNSAVRDPYIYNLTNAALLRLYDTRLDGWSALTINPAMTGTVIAGAAAVFSSYGPRGAVDAGCTTTSIVISTVLPGTPVLNAMANRGDGVGYSIRIYDNTAGGSGVVEERIITSNTASATPTLTLDSALSFTPAAGATYEIQSGRVYLVSAGAVASGSIKWIDLATHTFKSTATASLTSIGVDTSLLCLDANYVPSTRAPGDGFFGALVSTDMAAGTLTGQAAAGDAGVAADEYRNFVIRITLDAGTPLAVGQRRRITTHTAGASPVYTLASNWTTTPSVGASYVIENNDDIIMWTNGVNTTWRYDQENNAWDTTTYAVRPSVMAIGCASVHPFGVTLDSQKNHRYSYIYSWRGGNNVTLDLFDIAGAATGAWTSTISYVRQSGESPTVGHSITYDGATLDGKYAYLYRGESARQEMWRFDCLNRVMAPFTWLRYTEGAINTGNKLSTSLFIDGATKLAFLHRGVNTSLYHFSIALQR